MNDDIILFHCFAARQDVEIKDAKQLLKDSRILHRWHILEDGISNREKAVQRYYDDDQARYFDHIIYYPSHWDPAGSEETRKVADTYTPALARIKAICDKYGLLLHVNGDSRGCPVTLRSTDSMQSVSIGAY